VNPKPLVKSVRQDDTPLTALLDRLDAEVETSEAGAKGAKGSQHYKYRHPIKVHLHARGSAAPTVFSVPAQSLSNRLVCFLFGGFIYENTPCTVQLTTHHGAWKDLDGKVIRCRHVQGNIHHVTVWLAQTINPAIYSLDAVNTRVLLVEDDPAVTRLAKYFLMELRATVEHAANGEEAIKKAASNVYDVIIMDMEMPVMNGFDAVKQLRESGYTGTIVAVTGLTQPEDKDRCLEVGCDKYLPKPYTRQNLSDLIKSLQEEPIFSTYSNDPDMAILITAFVSELLDKIRQLERAAASWDTGKLVQISRLLKAQGSGHGFDVISEAAARLETAILTASPAVEARSLLNALVKLCLQVRSSTRMLEAPSGDASDDRRKAALSED